MVNLPNLSTMLPDTVLSSSKKAQATRIPGGLCFLICPFGILKTAKLGQW